MLHRVKQYIEDNHLLRPDEPVLVGLSGGADSIVLINLLERMRFQCLAVHCNFHLRGEEADRDESFVRRFCEQRGITLLVHHFDTKQYASEHHISIEMAARELRYTLFEQLRQEHNAQAIAVAHHKNDQVETLLLNLKRGTGIRGLRGMVPKNGYVVRPLLCVSKKDILNYATIRHLSFVEDSTNNDTHIKRNYIRQQVSTLSEQEISHIAHTADLISDYTKIVEQYIEQIQPTVLADNRLSISKLLQTAAPETVLYELLKPYNFTCTDSIFLSLEKESGKTFFSTTHMAVKDRDYLYLVDLKEQQADEPQINILTYPARQDINFPKATDHSALFDADKLTFPLRLKHWEDGDWFVPIGMKGKKKLSDFFNDMHIPLQEKHRINLLCSGNDIVWIVGYRIDNRYKITNETKNIAQVQIQ